MATKTSQITRSGDCVKSLAVLNYKANLLIADPPYNFGQPYDAYSDNLSYKDYLIWSESWLGVAVSALAPTGSLWLFCPDEWVSELDLMCRRKFSLYKKRHIVWAFTFGQRARKNFTRSHCHLLWFTRHKKDYTFNLKDVAVPSARQAIYGDARADPAGKPPDSTWLLFKEQLEPYMTPDKDTWLESRICGTFKERAKHSPNQIPVPLMERIVLACSDVGDRVVDPFAGTGSSGIACKLHDRNWEGFDVSKECVRQSNKRLAALKKH